MIDQNQRFEQLSRKYASVLNLIKQTGVRLVHIHVENNKLFLTGEAPSQDVKSRLWDQINLVNPTGSDISADFTVVGGQALKIPK